ncbi:MAG: glycosyltransferase [Anaerolineaceae bacterium]|nr:glycosyltransferase [Anaerolineaceae bacterium]
MRILFITGREVQYQRNQVLLRAFQRKADVDVIAPSKRGNLLITSLGCCLKALPMMLTRRYDLIFVGFYGHLILLMIAWLIRRPILFDAFVSTYDTLVSDRGILQPSSFLARLAYFLDRAACQQADFVLLDTSLQIQYFKDQLHLGDVRYASIPVGCNEDIFIPQTPAPQNPFTILSYSTFMPLHGVETIIRAIAILDDLPIHIHLVGNGQEYSQMRSIARRIGVDHKITWIDFVPLELLPGEIAASAICLGGHFGRSEKAGRVVPGKIYQMLAVGVPIIAGDSPAINDLLQHRVNAYLCPPGDPESLAKAIHELYHDPILRQKLALGARELYLRCCSEQVIGTQLVGILDEILNKQGSTGISPV